MINECKAGFNITTEGDKPATCLDLARVLLLQKEEVAKNILDHKRAVILEALLDSFHQSINEMDNIHGKYSRKRAKQLRDLVYKKFKEKYDEQNTTNITVNPVFKV